MPHRAARAGLQNCRSEEVGALVRVRDSLRELRALRLYANPSSFLRVGPSPRDTAASLRAFAPAGEDPQPGPR